MTAPDPTTPAKQRDEANARAQEAWQRVAELRAALQWAIKIAEEARQEWDAAPSGMRAGKLLIALSGNLKGYRTDIDAIHETLARKD
jgi:hypothetical protein